MSRPSPAEIREWCRILEERIPLADLTGRLALSSLVLAALSEADREAKARLFVLRGRLPI